MIEQGAPVTPFLTFRECVSVERVVRHGCARLGGVVNRWSGLARGRAAETRAVIFGASPGLALFTVGIGGLCASVFYVIKTASVGGGMITPRFGLNLFVPKNVERSVHLATVKQGVLPLGAAI